MNDFYKQRLFLQWIEAILLLVIGFYPINPANGEFVLGSPQVKKVSIHFSSGEKLDIVTNNFSNTTVYNEVRKLNNKVIKIPSITYQDIIKDGILTFNMTNQ